MASSVTTAASLVGADEGADKSSKKQTKAQALEAKRAKKVAKKAAKDEANRLAGIEAAKKEAAFKAKERDAKARAAANRARDEASKKKTTGGGGDDAGAGGEHDDDEHSRASSIRFWAQVVCAADGEYELWSADEHRAWANHFKALLTPLEEAAAKQPTVSARDHVHEKGLAKRLRVDTAQLQADIKHIKACADFMEKTALANAAAAAAAAAERARGPEVFAPAPLAQLMAQVKTRLPTLGRLLPTINETAPLSPDSAERSARRSRRKEKLGVPGSFLPEPEVDPYGID